MIKMEIIFTVEEAISLFREAGLTVEIRDLEYNFQLAHRIEYTESIPTWVVVNPYNSDFVPLDSIFRKYIELKQKELFLTSDKLKIYNLFKK